MRMDDWSGWRIHFEQGKRYWLRYDLAGVRDLDLDKYWRHGSKTEVELPMRIKLQDWKAVPIPLGKSNVIEFEVVG